MKRIVLAIVVAGSVLSIHGSAWAGHKKYGSQQESDKIECKRPEDKPTGPGVIVDPIRPRPVVRDHRDGSRGSSSAPGGVTVTNRGPRRGPNAPTILVPPNGSGATVRDHRTTNPPAAKGDGHGGVTVSPTGGFGGVVRDHRQPTPPSFPWSVGNGKRPGNSGSSVVRDHRTTDGGSVVRDHRTSESSQVVRDHRTSKPVVRDHRQ